MSSKKEIVELVSKSKNEFELKLLLEYAKYILKEKKR